MERRFKLIKRAGRKHLLIRWHDGERWREKSSGVSRRRDAERIARKLIESAEQQPAGDWLAFRLWYVDEYLAGKSAKYRAAVKSAARALERACAPVAVADVTPSKLTAFEVALRAEGKSPSSIASYLKALRAALNVAEQHGWLAAPVRVAIPVVPDGERMKGRPLTGEEFDRVLLAAERLLGCYAPPMQFMLRGFYLSGLRRTEGVLLSWDDTNVPHVVDIQARRPMLRIPVKHDKARRGATLPLTPDFVELLRTHANRAGRVFTPLSKTGRELRSPDSIGDLISEIGEASGVVTGEGKHPTAHDLRRSFGERWALRVQPPVLKEMMRHRDIKTTLTYYVGQSAERTANEIWEAAGRAQGGVLGGADAVVSEGRRPKP